MSEVETGPEAPESLDEALGSDRQLVSEIEAQLAATEVAEPVTPLVLDELSEHGAEQPLSMRDMRLLSDIDLEITVEFGRTRLPLKELLSLRRGSLIELSRMPDQPVMVLANHTVVAYGEVVMVGGRFGVHIVEIADPPMDVAAAVPPEARVPEPTTAPTAEAATGVASEEPAAE